MKDLEAHEQMEMFVLDEMRKIKVLDQLVFGGGTMLRLCHDLPRYSVDFDFYLRKDRKTFLPWAKRLNQMFQEMGAQITDHHEKHFTFLWEVRMASYPRRLKVEIRKDKKQSEKTELNIAHSIHSEIQVRLRTLTLEQMWVNKVNALEDRKEIRDAFDLEFLCRRNAGDFATVPKKKLKMIKENLDSLSDQDFKVKLGSILLPSDREVVLSNRFSYLKSKIAGQLSEV